MTEKQEVIDRMVKTCIEKNNFFEALEAAKLGASQQTAQMLLDVCLIECSIDIAKEAAIALFNRFLSENEENSLIARSIQNKHPLIFIKKLLNSFPTNRKLSLPEKESLMEVYIEQKSFGDACEIAEMGISTKFIDRLIGILVSIDMVNLAYNLAVKLEASKEANDKVSRALMKGGDPSGSYLIVLQFIDRAKNKISDQLLNELIEIFISNGSYSSAEEAKKLKGETLSSSELLRLRDEAIRLKKVFGIEDISRAIGVKLSVDVIDNLVKSCLVNSLCDAIKAMRLGSSDSVKQLVVEACISEGNFALSQAAAKEAGRELSTNELEKLEIYWLRKHQED